MARDSAERYQRIADAVASAPPGMHRLCGQPAAALAVAEMPPAIAELYSRWNGGQLFFELLELRDVDDIETDGRRWLFADCGRDTFAVDVDGRVWRYEGDTGELLPEGTRLDRWLDGYLFAEEFLIGDDGEFAAHAVGDNGELTCDAIIERERRALRRDNKAIGPRWRMARALAQAGNLVAARAELEAVVSLAPDFAWAWFDLARAAERLGDTEAAIEDASEAAACPDAEQAAFFLAFAARVAGDAGDEQRRAELSARATALEPDLVTAQRDGAIANLAEGELDAAEQLTRIGLALQPLDLELRALAKEIASARAAQNAGTKDPALH